MADAIDELPGRERFREQRRDLSTFATEGLIPYGASIESTGTMEIAADGRRPHSPSYQMFVLVLCVYALGALGFETIAHLSPQTRTILDYADYAVCTIFFIDFWISLLHARDRWGYFIKWGWLDLLSSVPMIEVTRWGRIARVVRVFRILRGLRATKLLATFVLQRRAQSAFLAAALVALLLVVFSSIAVLNLETGPDSNIKSAEDAVWWAVATITTVGYGDKYPITSEGRFVAAILMCSGVGLFGTLSGFLAAWFLGPSREQEEAGVAAELRSLREEVAQLRLAITPSNAPMPVEAHRIASERAPLKFDR